MDSTVDEVWVPVLFIIDVLRKERCYDRRQIVAFYTVSRVLMIPGWRESYKLGSRVPVRIYRLVTSHNFAVSLPHSGIGATYLSLDRARVIECSQLLARRWIFIVNTSNIIYDTYVCFTLHSTYNYTERPRVIRNLGLRLNCASAIWIFDEYSRRDNNEHTRWCTAYICTRSR